jgi:hypothetical protein
MTVSVLGPTAHPGLPLEVLFGVNGVTDRSSMVHARCTRDSGQFCTGSGRFETRNTLRPGMDTLCGGLQRGSSSIRDVRELSRWLSSEICF